MQSYRLVVYLRCRFLLDLTIHKNLKNDLEGE